jgi:hypothetical protein
MANTLQGQITGASSNNLYPIKLGVYRHYKGNKYEVVGFARHSETEEDMVVYKALANDMTVGAKLLTSGCPENGHPSTSASVVGHVYGDGGTWVRPLSMWGNLIEIGGKTVKRFEYIGESEKRLALTITALTPENRALVDAYLAGEWGADFVVSRGRITKIPECKGFLAESDGEFLGAVLYEISGDECEVAVLDCRRKGIGAGTALLGKVIETAKDENCRRVWLVTSNDNIDAIRFYQKRGWNLAAVYIDAMDAVRKLKPTVPLIGENGIPLRHELEFEVKLR